MLSPCPSSRSTLISLSYPLYFHSPRGLIRTIRTKLRVLHTMYVRSKSIVPLALIRRRSDRLVCRPPCSSRGPQSLLVFKECTLGSNLYMKTTSTNGYLSRCQWLIFLALLCLVHPADAEQPHATDSVLATHRRDSCSTDTGATCPLGTCDGLS